MALVVLLVISSTDLFGFETENFKGQGISDRQIKQGNLQSQNINVSRSNNNGIIDPTFRQGNSSIIDPLFRQGNSSIIDPLF